MPDQVIRQGLHGVQLHGAVSHGLRWARWHAGTVRLLPSGMPRLYVQVISQRTGQTVRRLGPYVTAAAARAAFGERTGQALIWTRQDQDWVAEQDSLEYRVPADPAIDA